MYVRIKDNEGKRRNMLIHRLVAIAFLPNPEDLPLVNHKDENILNNNVENLELCTYTYNNTYNGSAIKTGMKLRGRPANNAIKVIDINSGITWDSIDSCIKSLHIRSTKVNLMIDGIIDEYKGYKIRRLIL